MTPILYLNDPDMAEPSYIVEPANEEKITMIDECMKDKVCWKNTSRKSARDRL